MIPIEKVKLIVNTYETLEKELASGNIDKKNFITNIFPPYLMSVKI